MAAAEELLRGPLPAPWKYGVTRDGRVFFINDESRSTTWLHPVRNHPIQSGHIYGEDLPRGWEKSITIGGFQYYIE
ncbi:hypothetical protein CAPTEDRAFT_115107 [Capitella teleta]|uniref:WW domain-containing protein n=1 Tax=Capitella teleta TaxID=283909 RepID=R7UI22_CAPTE|nr:hypothetical protein CAPTEDRAFT_115107 [Capitella teleta]|eukprot:ELU05748.1 hypothetical protein CAPTEDRAFT_115107 [Capitella teleta]